MAPKNNVLIVLFFVGAFDCFGFCWRFRGPYKGLGWAWGLGALGLVEVSLRPL